MTGFPEQRYPLQIGTIQRGALIGAYWAGSPRHTEWTRPDPAKTEEDNHRAAAWKLIGDESGDIAQSIRRRPGFWTHNVYPAVIR